MIIKILIVALVVFVLLSLMFPRLVPPALRKLGRASGGAGRVGRELATGVEEPGSLLAACEVQAGEVVLTKTLLQYPMASDARAERLVTSIGERLAAYAKRREIPYRFHVVVGEQPNAMAIPGGSVLVTQSLIELCGEDTNALAGVLAHEIQHIDRRHAVRQLTASFATRAGTRLLGPGGLILGRVTGAMQTLLVQGYQRDREFEADAEGARLAQKAGYDPAGLARLLRRLQTLTGEDGGPLWLALKYFQSHPPLPERAARLERKYG